MNSSLLLLVVAGFKIFSKWLVLLILLFVLSTSLLYIFISPKQERNWIIEHALLPSVQFSGGQHNPTVFVQNIRDFKWGDRNKVHYKEMKFQLEQVVELKAVVSHFSAISEIAHVFMIFVLDDGRELGISVEARREDGEEFSIQGGLLARFEIMYVLASPEDLLGIRKINGEDVHIYPIKETKEKAQELFKLISTEVNGLIENPAWYHLFFKNCTNQLVKHVSILTEQKYPWYFQTLAPGNTGKILYDLKLIDIPNSSFDDIQRKTLIR